MRSAAVFGVEAFAVHVEVDVSFGLPAFTVVGLPDAAVRESRDRVRTAIRNSGFEFPQERITINLGPADVRKAGASFDLPIAIGILAATGIVERRHVDDVVLLGELSLDGSIQPTRGVLPIAAAARRQQLSGILLPAANAREAAVLGELRIFAIRSLCQAVDALNSPESYLCAPAGPGSHDAEQPAEGDLADVKGQLLAKRVLEVAAAGGHNVLFAGPPGAGKTMMARRLPGILPPLTLDEALETTSIHSVAGLLPPGTGLLGVRPFRAPHHTISEVALVGGGANPRPGEISLAHNGVLFLDEMPEFNRRALEVLRQPLEQGSVTIARAARTAVFPARFMLVAAMNPCPCGYLGDQVRRCRCTPVQVQQYRNRLSGPLRDRIDLVIDVPALPPRTLSAAIPSEHSAVIRERVVAARQIQHERYRGEAPRLNSRLPSSALGTVCRLNEECARLLDSAIERLHLSARGFDRVLKVSRTIADLAASDRIEPAHLAEAIQYRFNP
jgi:magnesium chelatase family protein